MLFNVLLSHKRSEKKHHFQPSSSSQLSPLTKKADMGKTKCQLSRIYFILAILAFRTLRYRTEKNHREKEALPPASQDKGCVPINRCCKPCFLLPNFYLPVRAPERLINDCCTATKDFSISPEGKRTSNCFRRIAQIRF